MAENKMKQVESLLIWLVSGEKDEDGNWLSDDDIQLVCDALEYYLNMHGQKNKMKQVAKMFDKELNEEFTIRLANNMKRVAYFSEKGLHISGTWRFVVSDTALKELVTGEAEIYV